MDKTSLEQALEQLQAGKLVAVPTETVYGLAADAHNLSAIQAIFTTKNRPTTQALSVLIHDPEEANDWAVDIPEEAQSLASAFWPGPLTMVLKKAPGIPDAITGDETTIGLRVPKHELTLELLKRLGHGVCAPSANITGQPSPKTAQQVRDGLGNELFVLDGGECEVGTESTIVDLTTESPSIIRQGAISKDAIEKILGETVADAKPKQKKATKMPVKHMVFADIVNYIFTHPDEKVAVISFTDTIRSATACVQLTKDPIKFLQESQEKVSEYEQEGFDMVLVEEAD